MKVRIGFGTGVGSNLGDAAVFAEVVDTLEELGFDSLWVSDRIVGDGLDPIVSLAIAAGRTTSMRLGANVFVLPGRDPFALARQLATLDRLSGGRLLPAFGLGAPSRADRAPFGVATGTRVETFRSSLDIIETLWRGEPVAHPDGAKAFSLRPTPTKKLDVWFGARQPAALRRCGELADGWIGSIHSPEQAGEAKGIINESAASFGRTIDPDHFGMTIPYAHTQRTAAGLAFVDVVAGPGHRIEDLYPCGEDELNDLISRHVEMGISKFVVNPTEDVDDWGAELRWLRSVVEALETD